MLRIVKLNDGTLGKVIVGEYDETKGVELFLPVKNGSYYESELDKLSDLQYTEGFNVDYISYIKEDFSWGKVTKYHTIGEYQILEYITSSNEVYFKPYINFEEVSHSYDTLEKAITGVICYKHDGINSQANKFLWRMISK
jgi:hypothetical protein